MIVAFRASVLSLPRVQVRNIADLDDASFDCMCGFGLRLDSDSTAHSHYALASPPVTRDESRGRTDLDAIHQHEVITDVLSAELPAPRPA